MNLSNICQVTNIKEAVSGKCQTNISKIFMIYYLNFPCSLVLAA
jgi:hypothetical protein